MTRLEHAAVSLHRILWHNIGESADWPITLNCDGELQDELSDALNELANAVNEVKPGSKPWPLS